MYIMFPIGIMYYFGVNLDEKFSTPDFWPKKGQTNTIPFERAEISQELEVLKQKRLAARARRLQLEGAGTVNKPVETAGLTHDEARRESTDTTGWLSWFR